MARKRNIEGERLYHFELSDKNRTVRWVLIVILLAVAGVAVIFGLMSALVTPAGWQSVELSSTEKNCGHEFVLQYDLGAGDRSASVESKELSLLYGNAAESAWQLFYNEAGAGELAGIYTVNRHPNQEITVDPALYKALLELQEAESRHLYLAPVYAAWERVIFSENEILAEDCDPGTDPDSMEYVRTLADYARDPEHISLELRPDDRVYLHVSGEYADFLEENAVEYFLDFGWLRNAAAADYIGELLEAAGYTNGYLSSVDGFTRNLDSRGTDYSLNIFQKTEKGRDHTAVMGYTGPVSIASLRSYPLFEEDAARYYTFSDGRTVNLYVDPVDGQSRTALEDLTVYAGQESCLSLAAKTAPVYIAGDFRAEAMTALAEEGIYGVWSEENRVCHTQKDLSLTVTDPAYTLQYVQ